MRKKFCQAMILTAVCALDLKSGGGWTVTLEDDYVANFMKKAIWLDEE